MDQSHPRPFDRVTSGNLDEPLTLEDVFQLHIRYLSRDELAACYLRAERLLAQHEDALNSEDSGTGLRVLFCRKCAMLPRERFELVCNMEPDPERPDQPTVNQTGIDLIVKFIDGVRMHRDRLAAICQVEKVAEVTGQELIALQEAVHGMRVLQQLGAAK